MEDESNLMSNRWFVVAGAAISVVVAVIAFISLQGPKVPDVKFATFRIEPQTLSVNNTAVLTVNVESHEDRILNDLKVITSFEDPLSLQFLSIDNGMLPLAPLQKKEARSGEYNIRITAINLAGEEMRFKGSVSLIVDGTSTDSEGFELTITK